MSRDSTKTKQPAALGVFGVGGSTMMYVFYVHDGGALARNLGSFAVADEAAARRLAHDHLEQSADVSCIEVWSAASGELFRLDRSCLAEPPRPH